MTENKTAVACIQSSFGYRLALLGKRCMGAVRQIKDLDSSARREAGAYPLWYVSDEQRKPYGLNLTEDIWAHMHCGKQAAKMVGWAL